MEEIVVMGPLPPPLGGAAKNTQLMSRLFAQEGWRIRNLNTLAPNGQVHSHSLRRHFGRLRVFLGNLAHMSGGDLYYVVPDGGLAIVYILGYSVLLSLYRRPVVFHHRNYSHIDRPSMAMRSILALLPQARHVFLDPKMGRDFDRVYGVTTSKFVVSNAALNDVTAVGSASAGWSSGRQQTVGFLSNLSVEKGFDTVANAFRMVAQRDLTLRFKLAGAPTGNEEESLLRELLSALGDRIDYVGVVNGAAKQQFFSEVGVFVFPTKFKQEAQPNVVYEALASGCFVVASDRGCIPEMLSGLPATVVPEDGSFDENMVTAILAAAAEWDAAIHAAILAGYAAEQDKARTQLATFLGAIKSMTPRLARTVAEPKRV